MEIKTTAQIVRMALEFDNGLPDCMNLEDERKKWVAIEDIKRELIGELYQIIEKDNYDDRVYALRGLQKLL